MANFDKIKKRTRLGTPPPPEMAGDNLSAPETAPLSPTSEPKPEVQQEPTPVQQVKQTRPKRQTGRTEPLATRVTPEFKHRLKMVSARDNLKLVEVLELALEAYEREHQATK